ncbi:dolichol-phosphate mannosyltransferase subunit 3 [Anolis carolinensis]|uniref:dolichol-phosphate mannosyltransferase subunit 3 n=1 Tax=Anolis carolinensis TaxID=28377 RepID=UPI002F2B71B8
MTKLLRCLWSLGLFGVAWAVLALDPLDLRPLPAPWPQVLRPLPAYLLVSFGCFSLAVVGFRLATFNDCEAAAQELQDQIREAKQDLARRGLRL